MTSLNPGSSRRHVRTAPGRASAPSQAGPRAERGPGHARSLKAHRVLRGVAMGVTAVVAFGVASGGALALQLTGNIKTVDADKALSAVARPTVAAPTDPNGGKALNIVLMGSDDRSGANAALGGKNDGMRSDTTMVMHISADRSRVELVSIPRDSIVDVPQCPTTSGKLAPAIKNTRFNAAFAQGDIYGKNVESAALCTMTTIEHLTDVRMDGFVVVDFSGFEKMIDALGGVQMCIPEAVNSPKADHLVLNAGVQTLNGFTALQYARARTGEGLGDGSDTNRIGRQQQMMSAIANNVLSRNLLTDTPSLIRFLNAATQSLTMSSNIGSITGLTGLAYSLRNVSPATITFMTIPWKSNPADPNTVVWTNAASTVWDNVSHDVPVATPAGGTATDTPAPTNTNTPAATAGGAASSTAAPPAATPAPSQTKEAGKEAFTGADTTAVCG